MMSSEIMSFCNEFMCVCVFVISFCAKRFAHNKVQQTVNVTVYSFGAVAGIIARPTHKSYQCGGKYCYYSWMLGSRHYNPLSHV